jgi:hypothetical protein
VRYIPRPGDTIRIVGGGKHGTGVVIRTEPYRHGATIGIASPWVIVYHCKFNGGEHCVLNGSRVKVVKRDTKTI